MQDIINTFCRTEKKYILTFAQYEAFRKEAGSLILPDRYGWSTICSLYYDTADYELIRRSLDKPEYKEKLRLRSYGVPDAGSTVYAELKKKYRGIVYKRRAALTLRRAEELLEGHMPDTDDPVQRQILHEISYCLSRYTLFPKMFIGCKRLALFCPSDPGLRVTFDTALRYRNTELKLSCGSFGAPILKENMFLMELKAPGALPLWLVKALEHTGLTPRSFSKYGTAYRMASGFPTGLPQEYLPSPDTAAPAACRIDPAAINE